MIAAPHPDDEVLGAGGLLRFWAMSGRRVTVLSVTDGEAADPTRAALGRIRRAELHAALRTLSSARVEVIRLRIPDGRVSHHEHRLRSALRKLSAREQAEGYPLTLIAPYERDGHPDHEAVGRVCLQVARAAGVAVARYPIWAWHHMDPAALHGLHWGLYRMGEAARRAKLRALQCFESQLRPPRGVPIVPPHVLAHFQRSFEAFIL